MSRPIRGATRASPPRRSPPVTGSKPKPRAAAPAEVDVPTRPLPSHPPPSRPTRAPSDPSKSTALQPARGARGGRGGRPVRRGRGGPPVHQEEKIRLTETSLMQVQQERANAQWSASTGVYIVWRATPEDSSKNRIRLEDFDPSKVDCIRLGPFSRCLCDHSLAFHMPPSFRPQIPEGEAVPFDELYPPWDGPPRSFPSKFKLIPCSVEGCKCRRFEFIPTFPEEIGESWLSVRPGFVLDEYRPCCTCNHNSLCHPISSGARCNQRGCRCSGWAPRYQCAACDGLGRDHTIEVEGEAERAEAGRPIGINYLPFEEIRGMIAQKF